MLIWFMLASLCACILVILFPLSPQLPDPPAAHGAPPRPAVAYIYRLLVCILQFEAVLRAYLASAIDADAIEAKFQDVRQRGRKRVAFG